MANKNITVSVPDELATALSKAAKISGRSRQALANEAFQMYVAVLHGGLAVGEDPALKAWRGKAVEGFKPGVAR